MKKLIEFCLVQSRENFAGNTLVGLIFLFLFTGWIVVKIIALSDFIIGGFVCLCACWIIGRLGILITKTNQIETKNWETHER